jgi:hemolysin III
VTAAASVGSNTHLMYYGEKFNSISHLVGAVLAASGAIVLITLAARLGDPWKIVSFSIYGAMLLALYVASTAYHSVRGGAKEVLRKFDHCTIYLLIAGSYTPFALVSLRGAWGWSLLGTVWGLALLGILQEIWLAKGARKLSLLIYLLMGWLALVAIVPLIAALSWNGFAWLAAGGLLYTIGIGFYANDTKLRHAHGIWHLFVLAGSACHYFAVLFYVA